MGLSGFGELRSGEGKGGGGLVHGGATPNGVLGSGKAYVPQKLAQKNLEGARVLTGASGGRRRRADGSPAGFGGGNGAVAVTGWCGGAPRLLTRREDTSGPCEGSTGVKEALRSKAAGNCAGGASHRGWLRG